MKRHMSCCNHITYARMLMTSLQIKGLKMTDNMKERIKTGTYRFHDKYWKDISADAKDVRCIMCACFTLLGLFRVF